MASLVDRLSSHRWIHHVVAFLRIYRLAGPFLERFPLKRRITANGMAYRITSLDQLGIESEIFVQHTYEAALGLRPIDAFIDLGCNAGWFALWLAAEMPNPQRKGLLIDANPRIIEEAKWHLLRNGIEHHAVVSGAAGLPPDTSAAVFHISPSPSQSSLLEYQPDKQLPAKGRITDVTVPAVSAAAEWRKHFGDCPVDLMKIDIEGNELDYIRNESAFIGEKVRAILLEWHKWHVALEELDAALTALGFMRRGIYKETDMTGVALYEKRA